MFYFFFELHWRFKFFNLKCYQFEDNFFYRILLQTFSIDFIFFVHSKTDLMFLDKSSRVMI